MIRWFGGLILAVAAAVAGGVSSVAAQDRMITIGVEELDYFPAYAIRDGQYVGAVREIFDAFAADRGYRVRYLPFPIKRLYAELLSGGIDLKFPDNAKWAPDVKKGQPIVYSHPIVDYVDGTLVSAQAKGQPVGSIRSLGTVSGFTPYAWTDRLKTGMPQLTENPRLDLLLRQVSLGRLDAAYVSVSSALYMARNNSDMNVVFDPSLPHGRDSYVLSSLSRPDLVAEFDTWMATHADLVRQIKDRTGAEQGFN